MAVNCSLEHAWQDGKGKVHKLEDMDSKFILSCLLCTTDILKAAWEYEQGHTVDPASNSPKPYVYSLPDRYLLAPPVYWNMRSVLRERGWMD